MFQVSLPILEHRSPQKNISPLAANVCPTLPNVAEGANTEGGGSYLIDPGVQFHGNCLGFPRYQAEASNIYEPSPSCSDLKVTPHHPTAIGDGSYRASIYLSLVGTSYPAGTALFFNMTFVQDVVSATVNETLA